MGCSSKGFSWIIQDLEMHIELDDEDSWGGGVYSWFIIWLVVWNIFIFPYIGDNNPNWLIFFRGVETTNQYNIYKLPLSLTFQRRFAPAQCSYAAPNRAAATINQQRDAKVFSWVEACEYWPSASWTEALLSNLRLTSTILYAIKYHITRDIMWHFNHFQPTNLTAQEPFAHSTQGAAPDAAAACLPSALGCAVAFRIAGAVQTRPQRAVAGGHPTLRSAGVGTGPWCSVAWWMMPVHDSRVADCGGGI